MQRLLAPDGCPWDREQTLESIRKYVVEEACEVVDAIDNGDMAELREELGDLLLQVVFVGELARAKGAFGPDDVVAAITDKLVRRHPHVFGDLTIEGEGAAERVLDNWERIKAGERKDKPERRGVLDTVPRGLPALVRAQRIGEKARRVGFDWPDAEGPRAKVDEELGEFESHQLAADDHDAIVNVARHHGVDAEAALRRTMRKFETRFAHVEKRVDEEHGGFAEKGKLPLEVLDAYWDEAKRAER